MTNIILSGANGKMGKIVADIISKREDCKVVAGIDINTEKYSDFEVFPCLDDCNIKGDVLVDFSNPSLLDSLIKYGIKSKTPLVLATTGYDAEQISAITSASQHVAIFFSFNMSLGISLLVELSKKAASILGNQFDIEIVEKHHNQKIDAPSGTAIMIADAVNSCSGNVYKYKYDRHNEREKREKNEIGMHSIRGGTIVGEHDVIFAGRDEVITLSHSAASKQVFAVGAVNAAIFLNQKPPGLYNMSNLI